MTFDKYKDQIRCFKCKHLEKSQKENCRICYQCNLPADKYLQWLCYFVERTDACLMPENFNRHFYENECLRWEYDINTKKPVYKHCKEFSPLEYKQLDLF